MILPYRKSFLSLFLVLYIAPLTAQNIFREGYIVKNDGTMLTGLVQFKTGQNVPDQCVFRRFEISEQVILTKENIKEFGYIKGNRFLLKKYDGIESFFELLVTGKLSLFKNKEGYFLEKGETGLVKLAAGEINYYENGRKYTAEGAVKLVEQLTEGKVNPIEKQTTTKEELLIGKVVEYNRITGTPFFLTNRKFNDSKLIERAILNGSNRYRFGILAGTDMFMSFSPTGDFSVPALIDMNSWVAGLSLERIVSRVNDRLVVGCEVLYINQNFSQFYTGNKNGGIRYTEYFDSKEIKPAIYLLYTLPIGKFEPFISFGPSFRTNISDGYYQLIQKELPDYVETEMNSDRVFKNVRLNLLISGGIKIKIKNKIKVNLNIRAEGGTEGFLTNVSTESHKYYNLGVLAGIQF